MNKAIKYTIWIVVLLFVAYNSVYFKKLDEVKAAMVKTFDAAAYARKYFDKQLPPVAGNAPTMDQLQGKLRADPVSAFKKYSHALAIGSAGFFLVKGEGRVTRIDGNDIYLSTDSGHSAIKIAITFVFGNAVRDASGLIRINDFSNTGDLNNVSGEIDKIIRKQVIPPFITKTQVGSHVQFTGAMELNKAHLNLENIEVLPVSLKIIP